MIGAIIGDISGSRYERVSHKSKAFELFDKKCRPTDDSVMSLAVARAIMDSDDNIDKLSSNAIKAMQELGQIYDNAGYGGKFIRWIFSDDPQPYCSFGNGSAMRVGPCGYAAKSLEEVKKLSAEVTKVSHDHPEGMKGAEAVAVAVFMAKSGSSIEEIKDHIIKNYYEIDFTIDQIRDDYEFDVSCQGSVPVALEAFFESIDFEDAIRIAISVGGDSDTIAAMAGSVAEAYYGIPEGLIESAIDYLDARQMEILYYFEKKYPSKALDEDGEATLTIFDVLDECVDKVIPAGTTVNVSDDTDTGVVRVEADPEALVPDFSSFDKQGVIAGAKGFIAKTGKGIAAATNSKKIKADKLPDYPKQTNAKHILNTVIEGKFSGLAVIQSKDKVYIGDNEISDTRCETYEENFDSEAVESTKQLFEEFRNNSKNIFNMIKKEYYLLIKWRNGETSVVCVDYNIKFEITKILS